MSRITNRLLAALLFLLLPALAAGQGTPPAMSGVSIGTVPVPGGTTCWNYWVSLAAGPTCSTAFAGTFQLTGTAAGTLNVGPATAGLSNLTVSANTATTLPQPFSGSIAQLTAADTLTTAEVLVGFAAAPGASIRLYDASGTAAAPTATATGLNMATVVLGGYDGTNWAAGLTIANVASPSGSTWTTSDHGSRANFNLPQQGTTTSTTVAEFDGANALISLGGAQGVESLQVPLYLASLVNAVRITGGTTTNPVTIAAVGSDSSININFTPKGASGTTNVTAGGFGVTGQVTSTTYFASTGTTLPAPAAGTLGIGGEAAKPTMAANGEAALYITSTTGGITLMGKGSANDVTVINSGGTTALTVPTGTTNLVVAGTGTFSGTGTAGVSTAACFSATFLLVSDAANCITSARRLKHDIAELPEADALAEVMALQPVTYWWNRDAKPANDVNYWHEQIGFIADDIQSVDPRVAATEQDGSPKGYHDESLIAISIAAQRNMERRLEALEAKLH